ncbi:Trafficking kinesin-binding protein 1 [Acromyrmex echinatior]|uniref:Trafficking kinesin-binding protein 1 n=1 Tax=Acromyrmex echinatior TaxID=103372 RepID=F4W746_ACREC|nr:Trafficking kinesin-binding protein 1 [Acromyrmex echinatior]
MCKTRLGAPPVTQLHHFDCDVEESEAISLFATASKLATVEDEGPKRPEGPIRPSAASLKVSPTARAILQASRSSKKLVTPVSTRDAETITENERAKSSASAEYKIMYLGTRETRRPKGPAKLREILEKREIVLSKWRDDVCSGEELPEVEIISLLEEQIPRYRLRADTLTQFQGYENADWFIPAPALKSEDVDLKLSPDQIRETLNYFSAVNARHWIPGKNDTMKDPAKNSFELKRKEMSWHDFLAQAKDDYSFC